MSFFRGSTCPSPHSIGEGLTRRDVRCRFFARGFPTSVARFAGCSLVLGDVERGAARYIISPVSGTHVVGSSRCEAARGSSESVSRVKIDSLAKVPTDVQRLDVHIGKSRTAPAAIEGVAVPTHVCDQFTVGVV